MQLSSCGFSVHSSLTFLLEVLLVGHILIVVQYALRVLYMHVYMDMYVET